MPPNFVEKNFTNSHKTLKFTKVFSLKSFPLYGMCLTMHDYCIHEQLLHANSHLASVIHVLCMVNFEKAIKPCNLYCYPEPGLLFSPDSLPHTTGSRIDKQLGTMEVHKHHIVEELWQNALNLAEQLKQVRQNTIHLALFPVLLCSVHYLLSHFFSFLGGSSAPKGAVQECGTCEVLREIQSTGGTIL